MLQPRTRSIQTTATWTSSPAELTHSHRPLVPTSPRIPDRGIPQLPGVSTWGAHGLSHLHPICRCSHLPPPGLAWLPPATHSSQTVTPQTLASSQNLTVLFSSTSPQCPGPQEPQNPTDAPRFLYSTSTLLLGFKTQT